METIGAAYKGNNKCVFTVWAPHRQEMALHLVHPIERIIMMQRMDTGYFTMEVGDVEPGTRYFFRPDNEVDFPDPASHFQPEGVHGPSEVVFHQHYSWQDANWRGLPFNELVFYELHVGTFSQEETFQAIVPRLDELVDLGITAIELMPVTQFPGNRNWGYDAVYPYAVQNSYGRPEDFKKLVEECHKKGIAIILDVVYNHLGPEGNYLENYGPYFTDKYSTPWGKAINFDGEWSDGVRSFFANNVLHWFELYHIDGLRIDAIHEVHDGGAVNFWELTGNKVKELEQKLGRSFYMIAESDLNSPKVVKTPETGGYGFDAQWLDDFHHALYVLLDKEGKARYFDFGKIEQLAKAYTEGFVHTGEYVQFRKRKHGASSAGISGLKFIAFNQNHDQVGNRVLGERLAVLVDLERLKVAAAGLMLSPYLPLLFMGEEYGEEAPFFYFVSHSDPDLIKAVQEGRRREFEGFNWKTDPPDPQHSETFENSKLQWEKRNLGKHKIMLQWHKELLQFRKSDPIMKGFDKKDIRVDTIEPLALVLQRQSEDGQNHLLCLFNFSEEVITYTFPDWADKWVKRLDSKAPQWLEQIKEETTSFPDEVLLRQKVNLPTCSVAVYVSSATLRNQH